MGKIKLLYLLFLIFISSGLSTVSLKAQGVKEIIIQNADSILSDKKIAQGANRLIGNVEILINDALLTCDSAYYYPEQKLVDAYRHVYVNRGDTLQLWGDYMQYSEEDSMIRVRKDVVLVNKDARLLTQILNYNLLANIGYYPVKGQIFSGENDLVSRKGEFYTNIDMALFYDSVVVHTPDYIIYSDSLQYNTESKVTYFLDSTHIINEENNIICKKGWYNTQDKVFMITKSAYLESDGRILEGDTVYYNENIQFGIARSNVIIQDTTRDVLLLGNYAEYYKEPERAYITDSAIMVQIFDGDSIFLHADTIRLNNDSAGNRIMYAYYKVKYFKTNLQGLCDSMFYSMHDSVLQFHGNPVIWSGQNQITSDYMELFVRNGSMERLNMTGTAFLSQKEDTSRYSQVKGKDMTGFFKENELYMVDVMGNGQSVYYLRDEDEEYIGVNISICSNMKIYIFQRKPFMIKNLVNPDATLYPLEKAPNDELILEQFKWLGNQRPNQKNDIFIWN